MSEQKGTLSSHDFGGERERKREREREKGERGGRERFMLVCLCVDLWRFSCQELHLKQIIYVQVNMFMYCARTAPWIRN